MRRVSTFIDDGRAFLTKADKDKNKYDLVLFALTDSLVKVSAVSQLRLENYLFTQESLQRAWSLIRPGGSLVLYNYYRTEWLISKLQLLMKESTGVDADLLMSKDGFAVIAVTKPTDEKALAVAATLAAAGASRTNADREIQIPNDNWPFLYLKENKIPSLYLTAMFVLLLFVMVVLGFVHRTSYVHEREHGIERGSIFNKLAFTFMGMAFLLLETKSIIQFSLLFGTTWINSSLVFLAILLSVLAANWLAMLIKNANFIWVVMVLLMGSSLITLYYPLSDLLYYEDKTVRFLLASLITFSPVFFANLVFSISFRTQKMAEHIFGWNLIGAMLGGILEYSSMSLGYDSLAIVVACCYALVGLMLLLSRVSVRMGNASSKAVTA